MSLKIKEIFRETGRQFNELKKGIARFWDKHTMGITMTLLVFVFFVALFWNRIFISIDSGEQGIRWSRISGTRLDEQYGEGLHIIWPWDKMYIYTTRIQTKGGTMQILTSEGLSINVEFIYRFYAIRDSIPVIHKNLGVNYAETFVAPEVEAASMSIIGNYSPEELYKVSSLVVQSTIKYYLNKQLIARNIVVDDYLIKKISLPDIVSQSIEKKIVAEQLSYEFDYKIITEEKEKKRKAIEAEGIKNFEEISNIPILKWKGLEVTSDFAKSQNAKIIIMGTGDKDLPLLLNTEK
ncbi:MAG: prohibitin family protein [Prolixibacteraceae bacterium]|jgi:regulator of protease activity HflC (stomatin/prohibitin superfamily)|nr:prohibitin family protein [Prolixibacteraceae bacterium]